MEGNAAKKEQRAGVPGDTNAAAAPQSHEKETRPSTGATATTDLEEQRERARQNNPNGTSDTHNGVSVEQAQADFAELQRSLSGLSRASRTQSHASRRGTVTDIEKGGPETAVGSLTDSPVSHSTDDVFDLEAVLHGGLEAEREAGIKPKHIGVLWDGLTVKGMGGFENFVQTFPDAFKNFIDYWHPLKSLLGLGPKGNEVTILDDFRGLVKPGEMVLVLGKPGSGCTTFLKSITNQRYGYTAVDGEVLYGPFTAEEFDKYRGESVYCQEDEVHHATLTVEQTLGFAIDVKTPKKLPAGVDKAKFKEDVITMLLKMFNIEHTRNTVVGNALIRGVSGGERSTYPTPVFPTPLRHRHHWPVRKKSID